MTSPKKKVSKKVRKPAKVGFGWNEAIQHLSQDDVSHILHTPEAKLKRWDDGDLRSVKSEGYTEGRNSLINELRNLLGIDDLIDAKIKESAEQIRDLERELHGLEYKIRELESNVVYVNDIR